METTKQCPEFPYFGASYPDARCVNGLLHDMDDCDENGNVYEHSEYHPCPFCNTQAAYDNLIDDIDYSFQDEEKETDIEYQARYKVMALDRLNAFRIKHGFEAFVPSA